MCTPFDGTHPFILQEASEAPKIELKEEPPASPGSALPPSGAVPPWEKDGARQMGEDWTQGGAQLREAGGVRQQAHLPSLQCLWCIWGGGSWRPCDHCISEHWLAPHAASLRPPPHHWHPPCSGRWAG